MSESSNKSAFKQVFWAEYEGDVADWIKQAKKRSMISRLWDKDATLWSKDQNTQMEIKNRLGWLEAPELMRTHVTDILKFAEDIKKAGFSQCVLLGMGGSSLAPELFQETFGNKEGYPRLLVLDSTDPERVSDIEKQLDLEKTLFIVSSKSGGTVEVMSFFKYFFEKIKKINPEKAGEHFIAITDAGTSLEVLAKTHGFQRVFMGLLDVGGRFSALTAFGLVPAALIGVDIEKILECAEEMKENSAMELGIGMAVLAESGRDKLTILTSSSLKSFGDWAEQLIAESTGKEGVGVIPVVREPLGDLDVYGEDRFFVVLTLKGEEDEMETSLEEIKKKKVPLLTLHLKDKTDLGAEFLRWEMAVALACALLKINAFDQPNVQSAKDKTKALLNELASGKPLTIPAAISDLKSFVMEMKDGDYLGILAFLPDREDLRKKLADLQILIRNMTKKAVTCGLGPRYLHSTGQLHKGGPATGSFLLITTDHSLKLPVPGEKYDFCQLELAQAIGDYEALQASQRKVAYFNLSQPSPEALDELILQIKKD